MRQFALTVATHGALSGGGSFLRPESVFAAVSSLSGVASGSSDSATTAGAAVLDLALKGQNLLAGGDIASAVGVLRQAIALDSENDFVLGLLGRALHALDNNREAIRYFRKAAALNADDTYSRMMADILAQRPLSGVQMNLSEYPGGDLSTPATTDLERAALREEENKAEWLETQKHAGSGYRIKRLVLDAGHGGFDSGAVGVRGLKEKDVNLALTNRCGEILGLQAPELRLFFTRTDDYYVPLSARTAVANQYSADLFVSFHCNASENQSAQGLETYFCSESASSKEAQRVAQFENSVLKYDDGQNGKGGVDIEDLLFRFERRRYWQEGDRTARLMQQMMSSRLPFVDRGVHSADFYVLRKARMPSILIETGFISNTQEESLLGNSQQQYRIALSVASAIARISRGGGGA